MRRHTYRMTVAYDGSGFAGYQRQPNQRTVEGVLTEALRSVIPGLKRFTCGGRTDRGVHALAQVVSFYSHTPIDKDAVCEAVDSAAPEAIVCRELREAPRWFHARFSAIGRKYIYRLHDEGAHDVEAIDSLLRNLEGRRCFSAFARDTPAGRSTVRHMFTACARRETPDMLQFNFAASGFLRRQVRIMVATAIREAELGSQSERLAELAAEGDRRATQRAAAPGGLYLAGIDYARPETVSFTPTPATSQAG